MTTTLTLPDNVNDLAFSLADELSARHHRTFSIADIREVLTLLTERAGRPRYEAVAMGESDAIGNRSYFVLDNRTGRTEDIFTGYFAGQDARALATRLNERESEH